MRFPWRRLPRSEDAEADATPRSRWKRVTGVLSVALVFHVLGFLSSVDAIMGTRTPQGAIAWGVTLNTFPYVAVPAYWVLGRSRFQGYVDIRRTAEGELADSVARGLEILRPYMVPPEVMDTAPTGRAAERLAGLPYLTGNDTELLVDGDATFTSILEGIDRARDYVLFQFFIVKDDEIGREVQRHLMDKAREGIRVYFLYDEIGSHALSRGYLRGLRDAGVQVRPFNSRKGPTNRFQINFRNHRKVVVVDGKEAWIGGHNVGDEYLGRDPEFGRWRDTHMKIVGPAVLGVQLSFLEDWYWATEEYPGLTWTPVPAEGANRPVLILPSGPADEVETAALMFIGSPAGRAARGRRPYPDTGRTRPPGGVSGGLHLRRGCGPDGSPILPLHRRIPPPEGDGDRSFDGDNRHGELRQSLVPAELRDHRDRVGPRLHRGGRPNARGGLRGLGGDAARRTFP
jgi:cardiolipin synthase